MQHRALNIEFMLMYTDRISKRSSTLNPIFKNLRSLPPLFLIIIIIIAISRTLRQKHQDEKNHEKKSYQIVMVCQCSTASFSLSFIYCGFYSANSFPLWAPNLGNHFY